MPKQLGAIPVGLAFGGDLVENNPDGKEGRFRGQGNNHREKLGEVLGSAAV
jgi:hypothetical protein